jgi:hypothetical protein
MSPSLKQQVGRLDHLDRHSLGPSPPLRSHSSKTWAGLRIVAHQKHNSNLTHDPSLNLSFGALHCMKKFHDSFSSNVEYGKPLESLLY